MHVDAVRLDDRARPRFIVRTPWGTTDVELAVSGAHMALNAAAAIAAAGTLGVAPHVAAAALATATVTEGRMQVLTAPGGAVVVNDAYNANPTSVVAALDALAAMPARRRVAVLGLMAEIEDPPAGHRLVAAHAARLGIEVMAVAVDLYGVTPVEDPIRALGPLGPGDVVLVKGRWWPGCSPSPSGSPPAPWRRSPPAARAAGSRTVTQSPPAGRGTMVSVPSCAWAMLLTMARPRPTPAWSVRMRSVPRWNGSVSVETSCGAELLAGVLDGEHDGVRRRAAGRDLHGAVVGQVVDDGVVHEVRGHLQQERV